MSAYQPIRLARAVAIGLYGFVADLVSLSHHRVECDVVLFAVRRGTAQYSRP